MNTFLRAVVVAWVFVASLARADYDSTELFDMILRSDLIARGEIVSLREKTYVLQLDEVLKGPHQNQVEIVRFRNWGCAWRWGPYEIGQKLLVFANANENGFQLRGAAGEGESPIQGDDVYPQFPCAWEPRVNYGRHETCPISYLKLKSAIEDYQFCFRIANAPEPFQRVGRYLPLVPREIVRQVGREFVIRDYAHQSPVHKMLVESTRREERRLEKEATRRR